MSLWSYASWDYGYFLNYFTNDFLTYLPYGFEVHYKAIPKSILSITSNQDKCKEIKYPYSFSDLVFVDKELDIEENKQDISDFVHYRQKQPPRSMKIENMNICILLNHRLVDVNGSTNIYKIAYNAIHNKERPNYLSRSKNLSGSLDELPNPKFTRSVKGKPY